MTSPKPPVAGVIGWPVAHSKSPSIHRFWLGKLKLDGDYSRFPVHPDRIHAAVRALPALGLRGVIVSVPHKEAALKAVDHVAPSAAAVGAVNTIVTGADGSLSGHNTDVDGIAEALSSVSLRGARVCVIGAGGAARAAMQVLRADGVADVAVLARTASRARALLDEFGLNGSVHGFDDSAAALDKRLVVINASPMGMIGQAEMAPEVLRALPLMAAGGLAFDMVYAPLDTPFLQAARNAGHATADGLVMLIGQAATAFGHFFETPAPRGFDAELRAILTA